MSKRLTAEREAEIRKADGKVPVLVQQLNDQASWGYPLTVVHRRELLDELDAVRAESRAFRAAVIADLRGLLSRAYKGDYMNRTLVVDADSIELLIETLEAQQS